ncbi:hypothetical protein [Alicyclobacillus fastidiosus]|nr:hypothetical protein [Alicyclobacillus fastidiosus]WEH09126.1 hypothetical protein PYS47_21015 [Alicyclobacillus fastidiosus]
MTFKSKAYVCGILQKVYEKGLHLDQVMADGGYTSTGDELLSTTV